MRSSGCSHTRRELKASVFTEGAEESRELIEKANKEMLD